VLFLWATVPMLPQALEVMEAWGFAYKSHFAWVKNKIGPSTCGLPRASGRGAEGHRGPSTGRTPPQPIKSCNTGRGVRGTVHDARLRDDACLREWC
jgi:hypothetical protein